MSDDSVWLTEAEVMEILGVSRQTCYNLRMSGELKFYKVNNQVRYEGESIKAFVKQRNTPQLQEPKQPKQPKQLKQLKSKTAIPPSKKVEDLDNYFI